MKTLQDARDWYESANLLGIAVEAELEEFSGPSQRPVGEAMG
jgi:hypothetical protein